MTELQARKLKALDATTNGIIITDTAANIVWANAATAEMTGWELDELVGQNVRVLRSGMHAPEVYKDLWETISAGGVWTGRIINKRRDGSLRWEEMKVSPIAESGETTHFVAIKRDISALVHAEAERDRLLTRWNANQESLEDGYSISIGVLADIADLSSPLVGRHGRRVAELACRMAVYLELKVDQIKAIRLTGLAHDLGKLTTSEQDRGRSRHAHVAHAIRAAALLESIPGTESIQTGVKHHHESFDGSGFPSELKGLAIPLASRVVAVASAYDNMRNKERYDAPGAVDRIRKQAGTLFDPRMVDLLEQVVQDDDGQDSHDGWLLATHDLRAGMTLVSDLVTLEGALLYPAGTTLDDAMAGRLKGFSDVSRVPPLTRVTQK